MSNMQDLQPELKAARTKRKRYDASVAQLQAQQVREMARGHAVMATVMAYGASAEGNGTFGKISHLAKLFCIGFAFLAPSLLIWHVLL